MHGFCTDLHGCARTHGRCTDAARTFHGALYAGTAFLPSAFSMCSTSSINYSRPSDLLRSRALYCLWYPPPTPPLHSAASVINLNLTPATTSVRHLLSRLHRHTSSASRITPSVGPTLPTPGQHAHFVLRHPASRFAACACALSSSTTALLPIA